MKFSVKKIFSACVLILNTLLCCAQFLGGNADGHSNLRLTNVACAVTNANPFLGGDADGNSNLRLSNVACVVVNANPFLGGDADGHSNLRLSNVVCAVVNVNPFLGGDADGHSNLRISNVACVVVNVNPFLGGNADGHSNLRISNVVCAVTNTNPFAGGDADGLSNLRLTNVSPALCISIVLPIELLTFNASPNDNVIDLNWTTTSETNNDYFTAERSKYGNSFEKVIDINGAGNSSSILHYSTIDKTPYDGLSYYRLKQTDFDGNFSYSNVVAVDMNSNFSINVAPNPIINGESINISIKSKKGEEITVELYDIIGHKIFSQLLPLNTSALTEIIIGNSNTLSQGTYFMNIVLSGKTYRQKIVVY